MSRVRMSVLGALLAAVAVVASAVPAYAHDQLTSSSPQVGERLNVAPETVSLEFSNDVLVLGDAGTIVIVADAAGHDWVDGTPSVTDRTVTAALAEGMPDAGYELRWQVVSVDGHPISGVIPFTIGDAEPLAATATPAAPAPDQGAAGAGTSEQQNQAAQDNQRTLRVALIGVGGAAFAVIVLALIYSLRRRTRAAGTGDTAR